MEDQESRAVTDESRPSDLLMLFLNLHDKMYAPPGVMDYLTIRDLTQLSLLSKTLRKRLERVEYTRCINDDRDDYLVPFPGFPGLSLGTSASATSTSTEGGLFLHQLASLEAMHRAENSSKGYGALRGGILGDAPGLGKTITLLALLCSTSGVRPIAPPEFWDSRRVDEGWDHLRTNPESRQSVRNTLKPLLWNHASAQRIAQVMEYVSPPYTDDRLPTLLSFERYVVKELKPYVPSSMLDLFRTNLMDLKAGLDKRNRSLLKSEQGRRLVWERRLVSTGATLVVVPNALLEHWFQQIHRHLNLIMFAEGGENEADPEEEFHYENAADDSGDDPDKKRKPTPRGVVYLDGIGDLADVADAQTPLRNVSLTGKMPPPWELSTYLIVVTTFARCQEELQQEVAAGRIRGVQRRKRPRVIDAVESKGDHSSPLLQMRWLRMVVDEGHELGTHDVSTNITRFINQIAAERRWVLSGTPTTGDEDEEDFSAKALDQLQRLLFFLRHPQYGNLPAAARPSRRSRLLSDRQEKTSNEEMDERMEAARASWVTNVKVPFLGRKAAGKQELLRILKDIMVMHRKEDIDLPKPIFRQVEVDISVPEAVELTMVQGEAGKVEALLLDYLHSDDFQSLVDESQAAYITRAIESARIAQRGRGGLGSIGDTRPVKAVIYSSEKNNLLSVTEHLLRRLGRESIAELYNTAYIGDMSYELSRFRSGTKDCKKCPVCQRTINIMDIESVSGGRRGGQCSTTLLEVMTASEPHEHFLIEPERIFGTTNVPLARMEGMGMANYSKSRAFWRVGDKLSVDMRDPHPLLPKRADEEVWATSGSGKCMSLAEEDNYRGRDWYFGPLPDIASDEDYVVEVELIKWSRCGMFHSHARWYDGPRFCDAPILRVKEDVFVLSLDAVLSHGLDLSFVTHIFLLEPIDDAALLEQVTSRAHRLGATGPVIVETVNAFFKPSVKLDATVQHAIKADGTDLTDSTKIKKEKEKTLSKVVCQFCFRQFSSRVKAEDHEQTNCPRNPDNVHVVDPFHLSSVYREIKPPSAPTSDSLLARAAA
jgi:hypothetical protein